MKISTLITVLLSIFVIALAPNSALIDSNSTSNYSESNSFWNGIEGDYGATEKVVYYLDERNSSGTSYPEWTIGATIEINQEIKGLEFESSSGRLYYISNNSLHSIPLQDLSLNPSTHVESHSPISMVGTSSGNTVILSENTTSLLEYSNGKYIDSMFIDVTSAKTNRYSIGRSLHYDPINECTMFFTISEESYSWKFADRFAIPVGDVITMSKDGTIHKQRVNATVAWIDFNAEESEVWISKRLYPIAQFPQYYHSTMITSYKFTDDCELLEQSNFGSSFAYSGFVNRDSTILYETKNSFHLYAEPFGNLSFKHSITPLNGTNDSSLVHLYPHIGGLRVSADDAVMVLDQAGTWRFTEISTGAIIQSIESPDSDNRKWWEYNEILSHRMRRVSSEDGWMHVKDTLQGTTEITFYGLDSDGDTNLDYLDYCPELAWENQTDYDHDMKGDLCDEDIDNDGVENNLDDCPAGEIGINPDYDNDGCSDAEDADDDNDGIEDEHDSCPLGLASGLDYDYDGCMDAEDSDDDNDAVLDSDDACPFSTTMEILLDHDGDGCYDHEDSDDDNDGIFDSDDDCPLGAATGEDYDEDGCKNSGEDNDDDSDGITDLLDECSLGLMQGNDHDGDGCKDAEDADDDNDGINDSEDACPLSVSENGWFIDSDQDGCLDSEDEDDDNDGIADSKDACPTIPATNDSDADGCPSEIDTDDDNDGIPDEFDSCPLQVALNDADSDGCEDSIPEVREEVTEEVEVEQKEEVNKESDNSKSKDTRISAQLIVSIIVFSIVIFYTYFWIRNS